MILPEKVLVAFSAWYDRHPSRGSMGGGLVVLDRLKQDYNLDVDTHKTRKGGQVRGVAGQAVKVILERFGETRPFLTEGGRTSRGLLDSITDMLSVLNDMGLAEMPVDQRNVILTGLQEFLVGKVHDYHSRSQLEARYDPGKSAWQFIHDIIVLADENRKGGPVAQYLVGAKLQLRFPDMEVGNESYSTADRQLGRIGDFKVGNTAFHVTVFPQPGVFERCRQNIEEGYRPYLLVPDFRLAGTRQNAELIAPGRVAVEAIESFVSQNIEELSRFSGDALAGGFLRLLETYNERVERVESDKSMLIKIPSNLQHLT